jgi:uncharacterized protein YeaO (DUF488 family)
MLRTARVYEEPGARDGTRVLVDRLWPRGLTKEAAHVDVWLKDVAPSNELRRWYNHEPERFAEFRTRYLTELAQPEHAPALDELRGWVAAGPVTLLTSSRHLEISHLAVLTELLTPPPD